MTLGIVLVHGGGLDRRCWDLLLPLLTTPAVAVDLPGRGDRPADLRSVTLAGCAAAVAWDARAAGFDDVVLVGHSLAGCSIPSIAGRMGPALRHAVFVGATVPPDGAACVDTLDPAIQALAGPAPTPVSPPSWTRRQPASSWATTSGRSASPGASSGSCPRRPA